MSNWFKYLIATLLTIVSVISGTIFSYVEFKAHSRAAEEQKVKELVSSLSSYWKEQKTQVLSSYTHLRFLISDGKLSNNNINVQRLLAEYIFKAVVNGTHPDRDIPIDDEAFKRVQVIDNLFGSTISVEVAFTKILFINDSNQAIKEFNNFIETYPAHYLTSWAYYNLATIYGHEGKEKERDIYIRKFENKAKDYKFNDSDIVEMWK